MLHSFVGKLAVEGVGGGLCVSKARGGRVLVIGFLRASRGWGPIG